LPDGIEQGRLGAGHPCLAPAGRQAFEQSRAAAGVEVGCDFVEEEDGRAADPRRDKFRMSEDEAEEQCFLLSCRAAFGRLVLAEMGDAEIGAVRAGER
jgi:hypothetical protein